MSIDVLAAAEEVAGVARAHADDAETRRRLSAPTVEALVAADLMRMCVPAVYGGPEVEPATMLQAIMTLAHADGAAGWCSMIASTTSSMAAFLPAESAREIYGDPTSVTGGVFAPNGTGTAIVEDGSSGFRVSGRWSWGSGTQHCRWILGGAMCDDGTFRLCWFPHAAVTFHDTWFTGGMRGSGSLDYSVGNPAGDAGDAAGDVFVPASRTIQPGVTRPVVDSALARFPNFALLAASVAAVGLGVARRALDEVDDLARQKKPQYSARTLAENGFTQVEFARAEGVLRAARAFLLDEVATTFAAVAERGEASLDQRISIRLAATHAATAAASVVDTAFTLAGGSAVYDTSPLGRCLRDAHVVTQHIQTAPKLNQKIGALLLGRDEDITMF